MLPTQDAISPGPLNSWTAIFVCAELGSAAVEKQVIYFLLDIIEGNVLGVARSICVPLFNLNRH
jgi:hypothetical protein